MDKRQMRLTWNANKWQKPSIHNWREKDQGKKNVPYENQYGFGHEEWLFNPRYRHDGYQYGYVRGVEKASLKNNQIDELYLYTKDADQQYYLVAILRDVIRLDNNEKAQIKNSLFKQYSEIAIEELKDVNAVIGEFKRQGINPMMKFEWEKATVFEEPKKIYLDNIKYKRFQSYFLTKELEEFVKSEISTQSKIIFKPGKSNHRNTYSRSSQKGKADVKNIHIQIMEDLYKRLSEKVNKNSLSAENSTINGKIIDLLEKNSLLEYNFYEVKTQNTGFGNIREALGQILEYALIDDSIKVNKLVIIGPAILNDLETKYFNNLQNHFNLKLEYWYYDVEKRFFKIL